MQSDEKSVGVIVEFNPLHNGHCVHLNKTKEVSGRKKIIAVTSGNFVQRGEPAICDKWRRTKMALLSGVDIVIEIPVPYVIAGADYFARGSVDLLVATGVVDSISFGSESGDLAAIMAAGRVLADEPTKYKEGLRAGLDRGLSFAAAQGAALEGCLGNVPNGLLTKPNNGLAMEYCKALRLLGNPLEIFTTHRVSGGTSATKIRRAFKTGESVEGLLPDSAMQILQDAHDKNEIADLDDFTDIFQYLLFSKDFNLGEGLENRFRRFSGSLSNNAKISNFLAEVKTKRYTYTRLQRATLGMILDVTAEDMTHFENHGGVQYIRVLGFRKESAALLGEMTKKATIPVITHGAAIDAVLAGHSGMAAAKMLAKDLEAGDIFRCATRCKGGFRSERGVGVVVV
ncbi:MAG: nucleotidyltransferase family protein [Defluviitaleaceae bacterium]|nr:nucleotidyltransferase family protein [Defluviitaleaceae bacterium]